MTTGLLLFLVLSLCNVGTLVYDLWLYNTSKLTITERVRRDPLMGVPILILEVLMVVGLLLHLYGPTDLR